MAELALEPEYVAAGLEPWISGAPAHVVVCVREEDYRARYREPDKTHGEEAEEFAWPVPYWWVDAGAAVMLIWLAALDEELACGVYGMPGEGWEGLRGLLGIPADVQPVAVLTIGKEGTGHRAGLGEAGLEASRRRRSLGALVDATNARVPPRRGSRMPGRSGRCRSGAPQPRAPVRKAAPAARARP